MQVCKGSTSVWSAAFISILNNGDIYAREKVSTVIKSQLEKSLQVINMTNVKYTYI